MKTVSHICLGLVILWVTQVQAIGTSGATPGATLLLPYFEIDQTPNFPDDPAKPDTAALQNTYVTFGNSTSDPVLTRVTLWTDYGVPSIWFNVYLAGYDMERLDLRGLFDGILPRTGPTASHAGSESQPNINFPNCSGDFGTRLSPALIENLRNAHLGQASQFSAGQCSGLNHGDHRLRGYLTVDVIDGCNLDAPSSPNYIATLSKGDNANRLWGKWESLDKANNTSVAGNLVHIEASDLPIPNNLTFYRRLTAGADQREALGSVWGARNLSAGEFNGGTDLTIWREPRALPAPVACGGPLPAYLPLGQHQVVAFDENGNSSLLNPSGIDLNLVAQRIKVGGAKLPLPLGSGWIFLNLNYGPANPGDLAQSYVSETKTSLGRFQTNGEAVMLAHPSGLSPNPVKPVP